MEPDVNIPPISRLWSLPFDDGIFHFDNSLPPASDSLVGDNTRFLVIPDVQQYGMGVSDVLAQHRGIGKISSGICHKSGMPSKVRRIWLEWLGNVDSDNNGIPEHEFDIVTFSCNKHLGLESARGKGGKGEHKCCEICLQEIFPKKDAGVLMKCSKLVCCSRNETRAFHIYHLSCLIQLILLCEAIDVEQVLKHKLPPPGTYYILGIQNEVPHEGEDEHEQGIQIDIPEEEEEEEVVRTDPLMRSLFCPQCDEPPSYAFASIAECRETLSRAREEWLNTPELLEICSMGLCFPLQDVETYQEKVSAIDLLHFYRAE